SEYIKFPDDVAEKVLQDLIAATEKKIQNMPEYKIKDDKTKSNWQNAQQKIDRYYKDEVEPLKRRQNLRTFKDITNAFIKFAKDKHKGRMIWKSGQNIQTRWLGADGTPLVLNKPDGSTDVSLFINTTPAIVYKNSVSDSNIIGIMYSSYNAAGSGIFTPFFNNILGKSPGSGFPSIFQITDDYVKKIAAAQEKTEDFIFKGRKGKVHSRTIQKMLEKIKKLTGLDSRVNNIRKSLAIHLYIRGWNEKKICLFLGHSSINSTRKMLKGISILEENLHPIHNMHMNVA
ncbi:MAG: hypothetical protein EBS19_08725, partial [Spirochaetia bacterium]|nr:hypothetical protein [Spirochaetia bacterium]